ncbi:MAG: hypothetical protein HQL87_12860 [Magnetococcales bacterium]|nr:hypothetical protein [Magnetococcales bacterium]
MGPFASQRRLFILQGVIFCLTLGYMGCVPLPIRQGVHRMDGELLVDGQPVGPEAIIRPGDTVVTGSGGQTVLVMEENAFLLGEQTTVTFHADPDPPVAQTAARHVSGLTGFSLQRGRILSVFGPGPKLLKVPSAVIGIRGTGIFLQVEPAQDYVCLCYGEAEIRMNADLAVSEVIHTRHHESPRFLSGDGTIRKAPMLHHTDEELFMLEALVNRRPPFKKTPSRYL